MNPVPNSGSFDAFGESDFTLPAGRVVHHQGIPARLKKDTRVSTHPGNAKLMQAREGRYGKKKKMREARRKGPEIHSAKAHRCVDKVRAKGHSESSSWAICTSSIGKRGVYAKGHGGNANPKMREGCGTCDNCKKNKRMRELELELAAQETIQQLDEAWSDAARAASAAARRARAKGRNWRKEGRYAYVKAGGSLDSEKRAIATRQAKLAQRAERNVAMKKTGDRVFVKNGVIRSLSSVQDDERARKVGRFAPSGKRGTGQYRTMGAFQSKRKRQFGVR